MNIIILQATDVGGIIPLLILLALSIAIFLILRSVVLWYLKVDKIIENQQKQIVQQQTIIDGLAGLYKSVNKPSDSEERNDNVEGV
ncbi:hypothetical protein M8998_02730 [Sphingobacterium sp. lm-10]|uniref:hypothetical protein n=1 Tax=Sphingobacterium sp. lm-10 TaxID=2944904 RepID=UPI00201FD4FF|nr:hypothetical protein [Sphingobacterium sp. lm-10]MCL7986850.1 hypothetical protein [Sphingobacterium sp. lm-10]